MVENFLQRFDAKWKYIPGPQNIVADGLSRTRESGDKETEEEIKINILLALLEGIDIDSVKGGSPRDDSYAHYGIPKTCNF